MCREMAELGLEVARNAAAATRHEWQPAPPPQPDPATPPAQTERQARATPSDTPRHEAPSPSLAFARVIQAIRSVIALEVAISARLQAATERAEQIAQDRAYRQAEAARTRPTPQKPTPVTQPPRPAGIPSLLAKVSQEIGLDLEHPTRPLHHWTEPTGPPR